MPDLNKSLLRLTVLSGDRGFEIIVTPIEMHPSLRTLRVNSETPQEANGVFPTNLPN